VKLLVCIIIIFSWSIFNSMMDAIDFGGKPASRRLQELWHLCKSLSYFLLYIALIFLVKLEWYYIIVIIAGLFLWYPIYKYCKRIDLWKIDESWVFPKYISWIWNIKRNK